MIGTPGPAELIGIFLLALLLFGAKRLPEIGSSLGKGIREFKSSVRDMKREMTLPSERKTIHRSSPEPAKLGSGEAESGSGPRRLKTSDQQ